MYALHVQVYLIFNNVHLAVDLNNNGTEDVKHHNPREEYLSKGIKLFQSLVVLSLSLSSTIYTTVIHAHC